MTARVSLLGKRFRERTRAPAGTLSEKLKKVIIETSGLSRQSFTEAYQSILVTFAFDHDHGKNLKMTGVKLSKLVNFDH